jgi:L-fuculose-phosphate aldolase
MDELKAQVLATAIAMNVSGINQGSAGTIADMVSLAADGSPQALVDPSQSNTVRPQRQPSSEWRFHRDIYAAHPNANAIVHTHSPCATALACQGLAIPAFHYMVARFGGSDVRCADYATFGSQELSDAVVRALDQRRGCLMAHHGMVVYGENLKQALALAIELETLAEQYWRVLQLGEPRLLDSDEMERVLEKFAHYGQGDEGR